MNRMQSQVADFHRKFGAPIGETPAFRRPELRARLIIEEAIETAIGILGRPQAISLLQEEMFKQAVLSDRPEPDFPEAIDGIGDTLFVLFGAAIEFGVDMTPIYDEITRANMAKEGGPSRPDGKILKPVGWTPPDILGKLVDQGYTP